MKGGGTCYFIDLFSTVLVNVCCAVTLRSVAFNTRVAWVCFVCLLLCKEECYSLVSFQLLRGGTLACMKCPCLCLCWSLGCGHVSQLPYAWHYIVVKSSFKHAIEKCEFKKTYVFKMPDI